MRELLPLGGHQLYHHFVAKPLAKFYARIAATLPPGRALDIGCGPGFLAASLAAGGRKVVAVDKDPAQVKIAVRNHPQLDVREGDAMALPFEDESFDVVVTSESYHHWPDGAQGAKEAARVLRSGGKFVVIEGADNVQKNEVAGFMGSWAWPGLTWIAWAVFRNHGYSEAGLQTNVVAVLKREFASVVVNRVDGWWIVTGTKV